MNIEENLSEDLHFRPRLDISSLSRAVQLIRQEIAKVIVGQEEVVDLLIASLLANGHVLLQGVPGVAKTLAAKLLARTLSVDYGRIQFTPDLMPSDVLGVSVFNAQSGHFEFRKGPIFANLVLIDEINRAPAKTQSALFEVMEERQITLDSVTYAMEQPFLVIATQNPIEQEGTYRLPEAQLDRFLFLVDIHYPELDQEVEILQREHQMVTADKLRFVQPVISGADLLGFQALVQKVIVEEHLIRYIAGVVHQTRNNPYLYLGASPRGSIAILKSSKAYAAMNGRDFVTPEDIQKVAVHVLQHRVMVAPEREMEGVSARQILEQIIQKVEIPR
ncbi:MAG: MoxR family ATPase [Taibaiella sp.]|nr:MoxR family ATPase [Taibaiella sp.]